MTMMTTSMMTKAMMTCSTAKACTSHTRHTPAGCANGCTGGEAIRIASCQRSDARKISASSTSRLWDSLCATR